MKHFSSIIHSNGNLEKGECLVNIDEKQQIINAIGGKNKYNTLIVNSRKNKLKCIFNINVKYSSCFFLEWGTWQFRRCAVIILIIW